MGSPASFCRLLIIICCLIVIQNRKNVYFVKVNIHTFKIKIITIIHITNYTLNIGEQISIYFYAKIILYKLKIIIILVLFILGTWCKGCGAEKYLINF